MSSIPEFRRNKLLYVFNVFFDVNRSGMIDRKDFEIAIEKVCNLRGWKHGDEKYSSTHDIMFTIWDGLRAKADSDDDGQVSVDEWCSMWDEYARNPETPLEWQDTYMNFMFDLEDASNDGTIDVDEFTIVCSAYGLQAMECQHAFQQMAMGKETVNRQTFHELWKQFFSSDDPSVPGNNIFGKTIF